MTPRASAARPIPALALLGGRVGRHTLIYLSTALVNVATGIASVAIVTRFLDPAQFGDLAVLFFFATVLTVTYNAGSLQGTMSWVLGGGADEDVGLDEAGAAVANDPQRALTTGILFTVAVSGAGTALAAVFAAPLADLLIGAPSQARLVVLAAAGGATASIWRLLANTVRIQRRPIAYFLSASCHAVLGLGAAIPFLVAGFGTEGPLLGMLIGNSVAVAFTLIALLHDVRLAVAASDLMQIFRRGTPLVPVVASFYTMQLADVFFASRFLSAAEVGLYRAATRIGAVTSYWTAALQMAWGPMRPDPLHVAADEQHGRARTSAVLATYFTITTLWVLLGMVVFADELVHIAAAPYAAAANVIPLAALAYAGQYVYVLVYRTSEFPGKRPWFVALSAIAAVTFIGTSLVVISPLGIYGPSVAVITGWAVASLAMYVKGQLGPEPVPYQYARLLGALLIAALCGATAWFAPVHGIASLAVDIGCFAAFPALLVAFRVLPKYHLAVVRALIGAQLDERWQRRAEADRLNELDASQRTLVRLLVAEGLLPARVGEETGADVKHVLTALVRSLRKLDGGEDEERPGDDLLGRYLVDDRPFATRQREARAMFSHGVDPLEADRLAQLVARLRSGSRGRGRWWPVRRRRTTEVLP